MGIFTNDNPEQSSPQPPKSSRKRTKSTFSRSTQIVQAPATTSSIISVFSNNAKAVPYSAPRSLTAAAAQIKINDKGEFEQFRIRRAAGSSAWQAEAWEYYDAIGEINNDFI